jgi:hypothetical protein
VKPLRLALVLFALSASACADWGAGCASEPLDAPLKAEAVAPAALEFSVPAERRIDLGQQLLEQLSEEGNHRLVAELPELTGRLDAYSEYEFGPLSVSVPLIGLSVDPSGGGLSVGLTFSAAELSAILAVSVDGGSGEDCEVVISLPERRASVRLVLSEGEFEPAALVVDGIPQLSGEPISLIPKDQCPHPQVVAAQEPVAEALDLALQEGLLAMNEALAGLCEGGLGVDAGSSGRIHSDLLFSLRPGLTSSQMLGGPILVGFTGGFESQRAACVPPDLPPALPAHGEPADFDGVLPWSQEPYDLAVAVSIHYLSQGLTAAHRAGLLCRSSGAGPVPDVALSNLLPSLSLLGKIDSVRAAVWPTGTPRVEFGARDSDAGEILPRLVVALPGMRMDVFAQLDGADLRAVGILADLTLELVPRLSGHVLSLDLVGAKLTNLEVGFSELVTEQAGELREAVSEVISAVATSLVAELGPIPLPLPASAGPELREARVSGDHLLLYF